jgi:arginine exporter protein ArgO
MNDIGLTDILYTGGMIFLAFYGAIAITKLLSKYIKPTTEEEEEKEEEVK